MTSFLCGSVGTVFYRYRDEEIFICNINVSTEFCRDYLVFDRYKVAMLNDSWLSKEFENAVSAINPRPTKEQQFEIRFSGIFEDEYAHLNGRIYDFYYNPSHRAIGNRD